MSDNGQFVEAGCISEASGVEECPVTPPVEGGKVICCDTSGCNNALYSVSNQDDADSGSAKLGAVSMMIMVLLSFCSYMLF